MTLDVINVSRYYVLMIKSFKDKDTAKLASGIHVGRFATFERIALRKLRQLEISTCLEDLKIPPGNRLEELKGKRAGQYSIRINDQYRVCFIWENDSAYDVEIVDYH